jgi:hypothetical protein
MNIDLFFSGEPWFVLCQPDGMPAPSLATEAAEHAGSVIIIIALFSMSVILLMSYSLYVQCNSAYHPGFNVGIIDCWAPLPSSGMHILKRFNLKTMAETREEQEKAKAANSPSGKKDTTPPTPPPSWNGYSSALVGFTVANGERPQPVPMAWFTDPKTGAEKLVSYIKPTV